MSFEQALSEERQITAGRLRLLRVLLAGTLSVLFATLGYGFGERFTDTRQLVPVSGVYLVVALGWWLGSRFLPPKIAGTWYTLPLLDLPAFFAIQLVSIQTSTVPGLAATLHLSAHMGLLLIAQASMQPANILLTALTSIVLQSIVFVRAGVWFHVPYAVVLLGSAAALGIYLPRRNRALLERLSQQNQELRRQIADRAGQLASAIGRLSAMPRSLEAGMKIEDRYRVVRPIGKGGMGAVYEVERIGDGKKLAMKVISRVADREALARFAKEAQIAAQIEHPNVVSVLDVDVSQSGMLFLVMELVAGNSLAAEKPRWGSEKWARPILKQIAEALAAMHGRGVVHRDLKPANVLVDGNTVKVVDFGIASLRPEEGDSTITRGLTQTGAFMGTPHYMAPELVKGARDAQPSSDLWSFGVMAHELLTAKSPFAEPPILARIEGRSIALRIDEKCDPLIARCLSEDPKLRPSASELAQG